MNDRVYRHILLPTFAPVLFLIVATTPVDFLGCANRGMLAAAIALLSIFAGMGAAATGLRGRMRGDSGSHWWATTALILALPAVLLIIFA